MTDDQLQAVLAQVQAAWRDAWWSQVPHSQIHPAGGAGAALRWYW